MSRHDFQEVKLYAFHEPDAPDTSEHPNPASVEPGAGHIHYGVELDGVRLQLGVVKAGRYLRNLARHQQAQSEG